MTYGIRGGINKTLISLQIFLKKYTLDNLLCTSGEVQNYKHKYKYKICVKHVSFAFSVFESKILDWRSLCVERESTTSVNLTKLAVWKKSV